MATIDLGEQTNNVHIHDRVRASPNHQIKENLDTGEREKEIETKSGLEINKAMAPKLKLDGPLGHYYTEVLNRELSMEGMGAIVAARPIGEETETIQSSGMVAVDRQGAKIENPNDEEGYIYVVDGDKLESKDLRSISDLMLKKRNQSPDKQLGLAMMTNGSPSPTMESLTRCLSHSGIQITYIQSGLKNMAVNMIKKD